jgi:hypothetical protein
LSVVELYGACSAVKARISSEPSKRSLIGVPMRSITKPINPLPVL